MSPALRGENIPRGTGPSIQRTIADDNELIVGCHLPTPCGWQTVRPLHAIHSAQDAHRIRHERGMA